MTLTQKNVILKLYLFVLRTNVWFLNKFMASLHLHLRLRSALKHVECDDCDKWFKNYSVKVVHKRMYFGERPYKCEDCGDYFSCSSRLKSHHQMLKQQNLSVYASFDYGDHFFVSDQISYSFKSVIH